VWVAQRKNGRQQVPRCARNDNQKGKNKSKKQKQKQKQKQEQEQEQKQEQEQRQKQMRGSFPLQGQDDGEKQAATTQKA